MRRRWKDPHKDLRGPCSAGGAGGRIPRSPGQLMPEPAVSRRVRLGSFELDPRSGELSSNGSRQTLPEQPLALLKALLAHPGELVTRDELRKELWPEDTFVDFERGLNAAVKRLRDALGDSADEPKFIETIPRRGYRLVAAVEGMQPAGRQENGPPAISAGVTHVEDAGELRWNLRTVACHWYTAGALLLALGATFRRRLQASCSGVDRGTRSDAVGVHPLKRLTFASGLDTDPTWSPDGRIRLRVHLQSRRELRHLDSARRRWRAVAI